MLIAVNIWVETIPGAREAAVLHRSSTDVWHLGHDPWVVLPESALWAHRLLPYWLLAVAFGLGSLERTCGSLAAAATGACAHVVGTLVSEGVQLVRIAAGALPHAAVHTLDVGPSYVVAGASVAALVAVTLPAGVRLGLLLLLAPIAVESAWRLPGAHVDAIGHVVAAVVGYAAGRRLRPARSAERAA